MTQLMLKSIAEDCAKKIKNATIGVEFFEETFKLWQKTHLKQIERNY